MYYLCSENNDALTAQLICAFAFTYAESRLSYDAAHLRIVFVSLEVCRDLTRHFKIQPQRAIAEKVVEKVAVPFSDFDKFRRKLES